MVISIRRINLGGGFRYLMESVAVGDGPAGRSNDLTRTEAAPGPKPQLHCSSCSEEILMAKGQPFSVRLQEATERLVEAEARRTRRTKSAVVEAFTEETARTRRFPGIAFRGDDARRRAWVIGSGLDVWEIIHMLEDFGSADALVAETQLSTAQVRVAVAYRDAYSDECAEAIVENRRPIADVDVLFPFIAVADA